MEQQETDALGFAWFGGQRRRCHVQGNVNYRLARSELLVCKPSLAPTHATVHHMFRFTLAHAKHLKRTNLHMTIAKTMVRDLNKTT